MWGEYSQEVKANSVQLAAAAALSRIAGDSRPLFRALSDICATVRNAAMALATSREDASLTFALESFFNAWVVPLLRDVEASPAAETQALACRALAAKKKAGELALLASDAAAWEPEESARSHEYALEDYRRISAPEGAPIVLPQRNARGLTLEETIAAVTAERLAQVRNGQLDGRGAAELDVPPVRPSRMRRNSRRCTVM